MPVPFREVRRDASAGLAGFLRFIEEENGLGVRGALFVIDAFGEPVDFAFARTDVPTPFLWRSGGATRNATARLAAALFHACPKTPSLLLVLAAEIDPRVFTDDIVVEASMGRVESGFDTPNGLARSRDNEVGPVEVSWVGRTPAPDSIARQTFDALAARDLLREPFDRAGAGLDEAFRG